MKRWPIVLAALLLVVFGGPWLLPRPGLDGAIPDRPFEDSAFLEIDGVRLHWRGRDGDAGDARPLVVLLHGFGGSSFSWRKTLDALESAGFDVIAPDLPPFGYSERTGRGPDWATLVQRLAERQRDSGSVIWVGHSMGAGVAARAAGRWPDRTDDLILVGGTPGLRRSDPLMRIVSGVSSFRRAAESWAAWRLAGAERIRALLTSAFGRPPNEAELQGYRAPLTIQGTYPALLVRLDGEPDGPTPDELPASTHLIWGESDAWVPLERGRALVRNRPDIGPITIIDEAGHNPMDTHPDAFQRALLSRIGRTDPETRRVR